MDDGDGILYIADMQEQTDYINEAGLCGADEGVMFRDNFDGAGLLDDGDGDPSPHTKGGITTRHRPVDTHRLHRALGH